MAIATAYNDLGSKTIEATLVESLDNIELIQIPNGLTESEALNSTFFNLEQCNGESVDMENLPISVKSENVPMNDQLNNSGYSDGLELVNYRVQLSDQFNVANQVEFGDEQLNATDTQNNLSIDGIYGLDDSAGTNDVVLSYLCSDGVLFEDLPMDISNEYLMSNKDNLVESDDDTCTEYEKLCRSMDSTQLESYLNWLDSVIEATNLTLDFNSNGYPDPLKFSVPHVRHTNFLTSKHFYSFSVLISFLCRFSYTLKFYVPNFRREPRKSDYQTQQQSSVRVDTKISQCTRGFSQTLH